MEARLSRPLAALGAAVAIVAVTSAARANVMTFNPLPPNFAQITVYSEDGITIDAIPAGFHFHPVAGPVAGDTEARMFNSDAFPQVVNMGGLAFSLISIEFSDFAGTIDAVLTASSGAVEIINTPGTFLFGAGWAGITSFTITSQQGGADLSFDVDDITTRVPEPGSLALLGAAAAGLVLILRKSKRA